MLIHIEQSMLWRDDDIPRQLDSQPNDQSEVTGRSSGGHFVVNKSTFISKSHEIMSSDSYSNIHWTHNSITSNVISSLRFPLIIGIVLMHANIHIGNSSFPIYESVYYLIAQIIARVAVPMFFLFSGFLFLATHEFTLKLYGIKLKKRIRTLLIPYIFWNAIPLLYAIFLQLTSNSHIEIDPKTLFATFWNIHKEPIPASTTPSYPSVIQFWYIRDLMIVMILSPIIHYFIKQFKVLVPIILAFLWIFNIWYHLTGFSITALFFFSLGFYLSQHNHNFMEMLKPHTYILGAIYAISMIPIFIQKDIEWNALRRINILIGMMFLISLTTRLISSRTWQPKTLLTNSSFFIFAYHTIAFQFMLLIIKKFIPLQSITDIQLVLLYFTWSATTVIFGVIIYYLLHKMYPKGLLLITGGR